jgi:hypothetical protein
MESPSDHHYMGVAGQRFLRRFVAGNAFLQEFVAFRVISSTSCAIDGRGERAQICVRPTP